jgi:DnaK suppressor protein
MVEIPTNGNGGLVWNRLHSEREDICEALLKEPVSGSEAERAMTAISKEEATMAANWHRELLQARLRKIDDALDRLMSGSYGNCCKCGRWIQDTKLDFDPAVAFCVECWEREVKKLRDENSSSSSRNEEQVLSTSDSVDQTDQPDAYSGVSLASLSPFDTIRVQTRNSTYRIFLLDPQTGRSLVEGGLHFVEPVEALVYGSTLKTIFKNGEIVVGLRIEMWVDGKLTSTSPVQSVSVEHCLSAAPSSAGVLNLEM